MFFRKDSDRKRTDLAAFRRYLRLFKEETERYGAELVVVLIPTKEQVDRRYFNEVGPGHKSAYVALKAAFVSKVGASSEHIGRGASRCCRVPPTRQLLSESEGSPTWAYDSEPHARQQ